MRYKLRNTINVTYSSIMVWVTNCLLTASLSCSSKLIYSILQTWIPTVTLPLWSHSSMFPYGFRTLSNGTMSWVAGTVNYSIQWTRCRLFIKPDKKSIHEFREGHSSRIRIQLSLCPFEPPNRHQFQPRNPPISDPKPTVSRTHFRPTSAPNAPISVPLQRPNAPISAPSYWYFFFLSVLRLFY